MVARAWGDRGDAKKRDRSQPQTRGVEEMFVRNDLVSLCLLVNRRAQTMRIVDFRAGPSSAKRQFVLKLARREEIAKVYTLVERDEVGTWLKLGFTKEGTIPGFYKRSDAFILGCAVQASDANDAVDVTMEGADEDEAPEHPSQTIAYELAEKTMLQAKKRVKDLLDQQLPATKLAPVREADVKKAIDRAVRTGRALTAFEPFGRDVERRFYQLTSRGGFELVASTESQSCFGNAFLELLTAPRTEAEKLATITALRTLCDTLLAEGVVGCFAFAPSDDLSLATAFVFNGFRRTGLLLDHLVVGGARKDATIWSRKLANPADE